MMAVKTVLLNWSEAFQNHPKLKIFTKVNGGKATALILELKI